MFTLSAEDLKALEEIFDEEYLEKTFNEWVELMELEYGDIENPPI